MKTVRNISCEKGYKLRIYGENIYIPNVIYSSKVKLLEYNFICFLDGMSV
jgi:hypothetical protein